MYDQLKAPGDQRKVHRITREQPVAKGDFVFAQIDSIVKAGMVTRGTFSMETNYGICANGYAGD